MVCVLRGKDVQRIAKQELGADVSLTTVHRTPQRLGDSCLAPRPRREKQDLDAQRQFREVAAPPCPQRLEAVRPGGWPDAPLLRISIMDEARFGQQGTLASVWAPKGNAPDSGQADPGFTQMGGKFT